MPQDALSCSWGEGKERIEMQYLRFVPEEFGKDPEKRWPLILFLHGAGERGHDTAIVKRHGIPKVVESWPDFPFIALSPQCGPGLSWESYVTVLPLMLDEASRALPVDGSRVYLTGISMGGYGVWRLAVEHPDRFAALAPICGYGTPSKGFPKRACVLKDVPIWVFHGARDEVVPVEESRVLVDALKGCGGKVRFTVYPDAGHDSWTRTYGNPALYDWFLEHTRPGA